MLARFAWIVSLSVSLAFGLLGQKADSLRDQVIAAERAELDALKAGDLAAFSALIADDAVFVDASGPASKAEVVKHVTDFRLRDYTMSNIQVVELSPDSGLLVYRVIQNGTSHGKEFSSTVLVSAVWTRRNGKWVCRFSQETAAK